MKKKPGGKRNNSGRKPVDDKKIQLPLYIPGSWVVAIGWDAAKELCYKTLEKKAILLEKK